jgi:hypothetical protein
MSAREHVWQSYADERDKLRQCVVANLRTDMSRFVGQPNHADTELIVSDSMHRSAHVAVMNAKKNTFSIPPTTLQDTCLHIFHFFAFNFASKRSS